MPAFASRPRRFARSLVRAGVLAACAQAAHSQAPPATDGPASVVAPSTTRLPEVQINGNYLNSVGSSDAASAGTVTAKLIESRPTLRPAEVLEFVPGVIVTQHSGDGKANQYYLRGFNLDHGTDFATFVDGMPVNMPTHAHGHGYSDLNWLIPELVDRIRYRKGPYYAEEGDFASAGSARIDLFDALPRGVATLTLGQDRYGRALLASSSKLGGGHRPLRARVRAQRRPLGQPRKIPPQQRRPALRHRRRAKPVDDHRHGLRGRLELDRPDPAASRRLGSDRPLRRARCERRRQHLSLQRLGRPRAPLRRRRLQARRLCHPLPAQAVLELHVLPRAPGRPGPDGDRRRPVRAVRRAQGLRPGDAAVHGTRSSAAPTRSTRSACSCATTGSIRSALYATVGARARRHDAGKRRSRDQRRPLRRELDAMVAVVSQRRRGARRPLLLRRQELDRREQRQAQRRPRFAQAFARLRPLAEDRVLRQLRQRLPQQRRARDDRHGSQRRQAIRSGP